MTDHSKLIFINCSGESFTPTTSGAISTWIWEVCQAAKRDGSFPAVFSRGGASEPWPWNPLTVIPFPDIPWPWRFRGGGRALGYWQRLLGWRRPMQAGYFSRLVGALKTAGHSKSTLFLQNDLEAAVVLRNAFPEAVIIHLAQNNDSCASRFRKRFPKSVNVALAVSNYCADWNADYFGCPVKTLYSGVNTDVFSPSADPPSGAPVVNFHGRTSSVKGLDLLFQAGVALAGKGLKFSIQAIGSTHWGFNQTDGYQRRLTDQARELEGMGIAVRRPGHVDRFRLADELRKAQIHCVPARWDEPFGLTTLEGMACGLATVASRTGGTPEIVGDAGLLFERENVEQLAGHLERLITDENLRAQYALKARKRAEEFTWDRTWQKIKAMLPAQ